MHPTSTLAGNASFGVDIGHSSTKICAALFDNPNLRFKAICPTVVIPASKIADEQTAQIAARDTVTIDGQSYFFGETAIMQGNATVFSGQDRDWIKTKIHDVLVLGAWKKAMTMIKCQPQAINLVLGLPMSFYSSQKKDLKNRVEALLSSYLLPNQKLKILIRPQSLVPLINRQYLVDGRPNPQYKIDIESWAVIDVGHFTTDFAIQIRDQVRDIAGDSSPGMSKVYTAVTSEFQAKGYPAGLESIDEAIKTRKLLEYGEYRDVSSIIDAAAQPLRDLIVDRAHTLLGDVAPRLKGVIVAGGGAPVIFNAIKTIYRNAVQEPDHRLSIAEGLCRFGLFAHHANAEATA